MSAANKASWSIDICQMLTAERAKRVRLKETMACRVRHYKITYFKDKFGICLNKSCRNNKLLSAAGQMTS